MNAYKILGVRINATQAEIKKAFIIKAKELHPDSPGGHEEKFKELMTAYTQIKNKSPEIKDNIDLNYTNLWKKYERPINNQKYYQKEEKA
jgi:DnaJ-class molecular chaperone with C-terminal Zn finger domain